MNRIISIVIAFSLSAVLVSIGRCDNGAISSQPNTTAVNDDDIDRVCVHYALLAEQFSSQCSSYYNIDSSRILGPAELELQRERNVSGTNCNHYQNGTVTQQRPSENNTLIINFCVFITAPLYLNRYVCSDYYNFTESDLKYPFGTADVCTSVSNGSCFTLQQLSLCSLGDQSQCC